MEDTSSPCICTCSEDVDHERSRTHTSAHRGTISGHVPGVLPWIRTGVIVLLCHLSVCLSDHVTTFTPKIPAFSPADVTTFRYQIPGSSDFVQYYRYLNLVDGKLYVGAMNYLFQLNTTNILTNPRASLKIRNEKVNNNQYLCLQKGKNQEFDCQNHIRAIIPKEDGTLQICGTAAFSPMLFSLQQNNIGGSMTSGARDSGKAVCPLDPNDSSTVLYVKQGHGNPGNLPALYSATVMDLAKADPIIFRPSLGDHSDLLRTRHENSKWLNDPNFIASFEVGDYVYFFYRENAVEYMNCGKAVYSRVARICKNDRGGSQSVLANRWTTYFKARLNCSLPGEYPFYFNELYDIFRVGNKFYGVFTTNLNGLYGSAVCAFDNDAIDHAFAGSFKEQMNSDSNWLRVPDSRVPTPRPGECSDDSTQISDSNLQFIEARPLMYESVATDTGFPLFQQQDVVYQKLVVDIIGSYSVYFLATDHGDIHKVVSWPSTAGKHDAKVIAKWTGITNGSQPIRQMKFYSDELYLSTDQAVHQITMRQCKRYEPMCTQCIQDPHCGWDRDWNSCTEDINNPSRNIIQNVEAAFPEEPCSAVCRLPSSLGSEPKLQGHTQHFPCTSRCEPTDQVQWYKDGLQVTIDSTKYFLATDNTLLVLNITSQDAGTYRCQSRSVILAQHQLRVKGCDNPQDCWQLEFNRWCDEFDHYKKELDNWKCIKKNCLDSGDCTPRDYTDNCRLP